MTPGSPVAAIRRDLDDILGGALSAVDPAILVRDALPAFDEGDRDARVVVVAVGKASPAMARGALEVLGPRARDTVIVAPRERRPSVPSARVFHGSHPLPDEGTVRGAEAVRAVVRDADSDERVVFLLSGGASALLTLPAPGVSVEEVATTTRLLMEAGADIVELNTVRKHLEVLKGGGLARAAVPTPIWAGILSDVVGDRLDVIGSGPASPDPTTFADALDVVLERIPGRVPPGVRRLLERGARGELVDTPAEGAACFRGVEAVIVGNAETAMTGAAEAGRRRGYAIRRGASAVTGEARSVGRELAGLARSLAEEVVRSGRAACYLSAGETTVTVTGGGSGGPNQEVALSAALALAREAGDTGRGARFDAHGVDVLVASVGTDGIDGPTEAAGAVADPTTVRRARESGLSPEAALEANDSFSFFRALGDHVTLGSTGTNVMDLHVILARPVGPYSRPPP